jgi:membrane carboxypeptidase/penicillin-binding protein PbpC
VEYSEWRSGNWFRVPRSGFDGSQILSPAANDASLAPGTQSSGDENAERGTRNLAPEAGFRITSPQSGDRYRIPPGVEARYATLGLRAAGGRGGAVHWQVDGHPVSGARWPLHAGSHSIRAATDRGEGAEVRIEVE